MNHGMAIRTHPPQVSYWIEKAFLVQRNLGNKHQGAVLLHGLDDLDLLFEELVDEVGEFDTFVRGFLR